MMREERRGEERRGGFWEAWIKAEIVFILKRGAGMDGWGLFFGDILLGAMISVILLRGAEREGEGTHTSSETRRSRQTASP